MEDEERFLLLDSIGGYRYENAAFDEVFDCVQSAEDYADHYKLESPDLMVVKFVRFI